MMEQSQQQLITRMLAQIEIVVPPPAPLEFRENGYGLHIMRQTMDRVEFFQDAAGMLVRMTKYLSASV